MGKTALVTGASGLLGREVQRLFAEREWTVTGTGLARASPPSILKLDITKKDEIEAVLDGAKPQVIIHCAANRFPDQCAKDPAAAHALNVASTASLAEASKARNIFLLYLSTDYVFSGKPGEAPYKADAITGPTNEYGKTKLEGEQVVQDAISKGANAAILRVPVLYGTIPNEDHSQSAVNSLLPLVYMAADVREEKDKIRVDHYAQRYPTNTADVARVCVDIANLYTSPDDRGKPLPRVLQFTGEERFTKYEICERLADILGLPFDGMIPDKPDENTTVQRPYDCHLDTGNLKDLGIDVSFVPFETWWRRELRAFRH